MLRLLSALPGSSSTFCCKTHEKTEPGRQGTTGVLTTPFVDIV